MKIQEGRVNIKNDILFGQGGEKKLFGDLFLPPYQDKDRPAIVIVHGGGWYEGDKNQLRGYGILLARYGFVCFCSSYRLSHQELWPAQIQDVKCAIRYLRFNSDKLGVDPKRIGISGNSAGGHLALMAGASFLNNDFEGQGGNNDVDSAVKAVCAIYPPTSIKNLTHIDPLDNAFLALMGKKAAQEDYDRASPINYVTEKYPPCMLVHGSSDKLVKLEDSSLFYEALVKEKVPAELHIFSGQEHAFDNDPGYGKNIADLQRLFFHKYL
jgi:acetyl esterase/lipase